MATDLTTTTPTTTIDLTGLPGPVIQSIKQLVEILREEATAAPPRASSVSILGLYTDQQLTTPTLEEFQEARREIWANFPREFPDAAE